MKSINLTSEIDVDEIKNLNLTYNEYDIPFGYLESDWKRMLLLQSKQPKDSYLSENLIKLSKLLIILSYFNSDEHQSILYEAVKNR